MQRGFFYRSTIRGWNDPTGQEPERFYCGIIQRVRHGQSGAELLTSIREVAALAAQPMRLPDGMAEPVPGVDIERYEAFDPDTDEILVFWRIPFRAAEGQKP